MVEEDLKRLRAMQTQPPSTASLMTISGPSQSRLVRTSNLELVQGQGEPKLRASSPLDQQVPLTAWMSPIHNYSDVSSVTHQERSLPSTLLTNPQSSISSPNFTSDQTQSTRSLRTTQRSSELHTIPENFPTDEEPPPAYTAAPNLSVVQADIHQHHLQPHHHHHQQGQEEQHQGLFAKAKRKRVDMQGGLDDPYWTRPTYRNADTMFPNYALNYPEPGGGPGLAQIHGHGSISPSRQYPDPVPREPISYWQSLYVQPTTPSMYMQQQQAADAVATSSPRPLNEQLPEPQHDYENMRYHLPQQQQKPQPRPREAPPVAPRRKPTPGAGGHLSSSSQANPAGSQQPHSKQQPQHQRRARRSTKEGDDQASLVSEGLDAEVTAITNSSSPGSRSTSGSEKGSFSKKQAQQAQQVILGQVKRKLMTPNSSQEEQFSSSSGIASKNNSQHHTSASSQSANTSGSGSGQLQTSLSMDPKSSGLEPISESHQPPFYENWPPLSGPPTAAKPKFSHLHQQQQYHGYQYLQPLPPLSILDQPSHHHQHLLLPPLTPHQTLGLTAKPQSTKGLDRRLEPISPQLDTSLDTPPSRVASRPGSAHSAPLLDVSIDRHYEFDTRTPTDELNIATIRDALPQKWNRPYLGYNPRRDREMGAPAQLGRTERVFSDSEIYSPVFPRGRPEQPSVDVTERVQAMKKEFQEYREQQQQQQQQKVYANINPVVVTAAVSSSSQPDISNIPISQSMISNPGGAGESLTAVSAAAPATASVGSAAAAAESAAAALTVVSAAATTAGRITPSSSNAQIQDANNSDRLESLI